MAKRICLILVLVLTVLAAGSALAEQQVRLPESGYTLTLPDGMEYDGPGEKPDDARFVYLLPGIKLEIQFFCYDGGGATLRELAETLHDSMAGTAYGNPDDVAIYRINEIDMIVYRLTDPGDPPEKGMKCIGYVLEDGDKIQEICFWYGTQEAADLTAEIIGSITDKD